MSALEDFEFFVLLHRTGSLSAAARELDVSAAATSKRLATIEKRYDCQLFRRNTRSMTLTDEGYIYLAEAQLIIARIHSMNERLHSESGSVNGNLRINASLGFGRKYMAKMVSRFLERYPFVTIEMELSDHPRDLIANAYDVGIRFGELPDSNLRARRIAVHRRLVAASPAYLDRAGQPIHPNDLAQHNCIILRQNDTAAGIWHFARGTDHVAVKVQGNLTSNDGECIVSWALDGHGVIQRASWEVSPYLESGDLIEILPDYALPQADINAVYYSQQHIPGRVRAFLDFFDNYGI